MTLLREPRVCNEGTGEQPGYESRDLHQQLRSKKLGAQTKSYGGRQDGTVESLMN